MSPSLPKPPEILDKIVGDVSLCVPTAHGYDAEIDHLGGQSLSDSRRLWSLWDMINFRLADFCQGLKYLEWALQKSRANDRVTDVSDEDRRLLADNIWETLKSCVVELQIESAARIDFKIRRVVTSKNYKWIDIGPLLEELYETLEWELKSEYFFHYKRDNAKRLWDIDTEWEQTIRKFPSAKKEITEAIDCYALDHVTACVFHLMRIVECGVRALARERQVIFPKHPLEWAEWENVIEQTESKAKAATNGMSRGPERDAARAFYTAAVAQLRAFKETRNRIMHTRGNFDELDAQRSIIQVRDFMNGLSAKIGEKTRHPIRKWP